jgi:glycosyltransferase involved in cell wall biosynthesis
MTTSRPAPAPLRPIAARRLLPGLTIVIACRDGADSLAAAIDGALAAASRTATAHEVIVVDDGSADESAAIARRFVERDPHVRLIIHAGHLGYGAAVRSGIRAARMPWILLTDADLEVDVGALADFVPYAPDADLLLGWRIMSRDPPVRRLNAAAWNWLVRRLFRVPVRDVDCAFKLIRAEVAEALPLRSDGPMISTELVVRAIAAGARIHELGVHHRGSRHGDGHGVLELVRLYRSSQR